MKRLLIDPRFQAAFDEAGLTSFDAIVKLFSEPGPAPAKETVTVKPRALRLRDDTVLQFYYKQYDFPAPSWRYAARRSKARCEYDNYDVFARLGIPCPARAACGQDRAALGRLRRAFIITEAVPGARMLTDFIEHCGPAERRSVAAELAAMTRRIHDAHFFHHDLVWRNILVTAGPKLWWIDCPRGGFVRWGRARRRWKDLASLDKSAMKHCTRCERLDFVKRYLGKNRLDDAVKQLARAVTAYGRQRWPEDWT